MSRQSQTMVSQAHAVQPAKPSRSAPAHRSASNPKMGNQATQRLLRDGVIQAKLTVNQPGDRFEQEADRVAEQVMRLPDPTVGTPPRIQRMCSECEEELHRKEASSAQPSPTGIQLPRGAGLPLPESVRSFFEPRYGQDFGHVRIHTGSHADESAQSLNALAYTAGSDIVFAKGHYSPDTAHGRKLLAHELTHVIQQGSKRGSDTIQRACKAGVPSTPGCVPDPSITPPSTRFLFNVNCDDFAPGLPPFISEEGRMDAFARGIPPTATIRIVGLASFDGPADLNERLSCSRAQRGLAVIRRSAPSGVTISSVDATVGGLSTATDPNMRAVGVDVSIPVPPKPKCGPDATDWFVRQVSAAKADSVILALQSRLQGAERVARSGGFSAERIAEGAVAKKVLAEEARVGSPARTTEAGAQIAASAPGQREFGRALLAAPVPILGRREAFVLAAIRGAALTWKGLVGTGRKYDFKNSARTLQSPISANCPVDCANTITFCPTTSSDCFVKDVPGNLFYAHVGRFVGWTELALQLGSQFAQLESSVRFDPPEDTRMISFGIGLPDPLPRSDLCSAINANRSVFDLQNCSNCSEEVTADVV